MLPLLRRSPAGRIVNTPGGLGPPTLGTDPGYVFANYNLITYQSAKTALNAITVGYAKELRGTGIKINESIGRAQSMNTWRGGCDCRFSKGCYTRRPNDCRRICELSG